MSEQQEQPTLPAMETFSVEASVNKHLHAMLDEHCKIGVARAFAGKGCSRDLFKDSKGGYLIEPDSIGEKAIFAAYVAAREKVERMKGATNNVHTLD